MASVGAAAASGLESGLGLGMRMRAQEQQEEQTKRANLLQDQQLQRQREADKRLEDDRALEAVNKSFEDLRAEGEGYFAQYGKNVPDDIAGPYKQRVQEVSGARNEMLRKRYAPIVEQRQQRAKDIAMRLQSGALDINEVAPEDLYDVIHVQTRRNPTDLIGKEGKPSRVAQAVTDIHDGLQYDNEGAVLRGANVLLEPELKVGLGEPSPYGGTIVGKQIVKMIPHPADPTKVLPVLKVYVKSGKATGGDVARAGHATPESAPEEGAPPGATGYYLAPMTQHRSTDPEDPPQPLDLQKAMDYAAQMQTLSTAISAPNIASKLEEHGKKVGAGDSDFLTAFYAVRGKMPAKQTRVEKFKPGEVGIEFDDRTGAPTGRRFEGPPKAEKATGLAANIQAVQDYAEEQGISEAEAAAELRSQGLIRPPAAGRGRGGAGANVGVGGNAGGLIDDKNKDLSGEDFLKTLPAGTANIVRALDEGRVDLSKLSTKGGEREKILQLWMQYNPGGDAQAAKVSQQTESKFATGKQGDAVRSFNTAVAHLDTLADLSAALKNGDVQMINKVKNLVAQQFGDPAATNFESAKKIVTDEIVKAIVGAGGGVTDREHAAQIMSAAKSPEQLQGAINQIHELMGGQLRGLAQQYYAGGGAKDFGQTFLTPRARSLAGDLPPPRPRGLQPPGGGPAPAPAAAPAAAPMRLPSDRAAAADAYAKLPSGATFIDPDGNTRRKP